MAKDLERHHRRESYLIYGSALLIVILGFVLAYQFVEPAPPKSIRIATGNPQNAYYQFAQRYREQLKRQGIDLEVLSTEGSVQNLELLKQGKVDIAFIQGGVGSAENGHQQSLASLYFEPLWVFYRKDLRFNYLSELSGHKLAIGKPGSGTRAVASQLLDDNGVSADAAERLALSGEAAAEALVSGDIDLFFTVTSPQSPIVQRLLKTPEIALFNFERARAYTRTHQYLSGVDLPTGIIDLASNIPENDINLIAPAATLVVNEDFHPALITLLLQTATEVHKTGGIFAQDGHFPSNKYLDFPINASAERFLKSGPPFLQRYMPFWLANLLDRLVVMLIPLITLMIPLAKVLPPTYRWRIRSRIYRWYDRLRELDFKANEITEKGQAVKLLEDLSSIENEVMQVSVPKSYADTQYNLRLHLRLIRERLERKIPTLPNSHTDRK